MEDSTIVTYYVYCYDCGKTFPAEQLVEDKLGNTKCAHCGSTKHTEND